MIRLLYVSSVSACFEHENDDIYFTKEFIAEIDGKRYTEGIRMYFPYLILSLTPNTE